MALSAMEIGKRALMVNQFGLDVTSNNISNVNTEGYSRRSVSVSETTPRYTTSGYIGTGSMVEKLRTYREEFFDSEIRKTLAQKAGFASDENILSRVEAVLAEPTESGMGEVVSEFLNEFETLSQKPENIAERDYVLSLAQTTAERFNSTALSLADSRNEIKNSLESNIKTANEIIQKITDLNKQVVATKSQTGADTQTLIDQRETAIEELSKTLGVSVTQADNGAVNVYVNGINIVTNNVYSTIELQETVTSGTAERSLSIVKKDNLGNVTGEVTPVTGEFASQMKHFNVTLDNVDSSGGLSVAKELDDYAGALARKVNSILQGGYGLNESTPSARVLFTPVLGRVTASSIGVNQELLDDSSLLAISDSPNEPGNNSLALKVADLTKDETFLNSMTPSEYYSTFLGNVGGMSKEAATSSKTTGLVSDQLTSQRESTIGVNLDEEAVNLIKYQKGFEASSRIINTMSDILATIINLGA